MRKFLYTLLLFFLYSLTFSQQYGNEWINYSQQYFRIFIYEDGIYRIDSATLASAGINMATLNPRNVQIFGRGQEQYIYIKGESNGHFNSGDYVEFYGLHNDGWYDKELYSNPVDQPNPNYSMFNDTAIYYLTINPNSVSNRRMIPESAINFSAYTVAPYFYKISRNDYTGSYFYGVTDNDDITDPSYISTEGWFDPGFSLGGSVIKSIPTSNAYSQGNAFIDFLLIGESNYAGMSPNHHVNINYAGVTIDTTFSGYYLKHYYKTVTTSSLGSTTTSFTFASVNDLGSNADYNTIAYINIKYPHTLNLGNNSTYILYVPDATGQTKTYLNISGFAAATGDSVRFYDLTNHKRILVKKNGSNYQILVPNGSGEKTCYITSEGQVHNVLSVIPVSYDAANYAKFTDYTSPSIFKSDYLIVTNKSLWNSAELYKDYRNSLMGGGYHVLLADVDELYDQFSYGIRKNPMAIKNFARFAYYNFSDPPKYLFLIGKGYRAGEIQDIYKSYRKNPYYYSQTLVPGFGAEPADNLFTAFNNTSYKPFIPIGRLAARNPVQVDLYRNKVMDYEAAQTGAPQEWMKNVLHFGGGSDITQQNVLAGYLNGYKNIIKGPFFGGFVRTFLKSSTAPIQINQSDSLKNIINNGVSLMTFFGHAAGIGFDQSIDDPSAYDNLGKYPFLLANSCLSGDLFNDVPTSSEEFVLIEDKGVIGYLASITKASAGPLNLYSSFFYKNIGIINYGQSVGKCIQNTIDTLQNIFPNNFNMKSICMGMTLHGDPAIKINSFAKPDYVVTQPDVYFTPANVTTLDSLFTLHIISTNIGRAIIDSFIVNVHRRFPDGSEVDSFRTIPATLYKDTISFKLPVDFVRGVGLNIFTISLDYNHEIDEISENNNTVTVILYIKSNDITPVYPYQYAIVPSLNVTLKASTGDPFAPARNYIFQVDTTDAFTNPLISHVVNHSGGVVTFTPILPITTDSIVYFWRVSVDSTTTNGYNWRESSFQYINNKRGWGQAHFFQFKKDSYQYVHYNKPARKFEFFNDIKSLQAQTGYFTNDSHYFWMEEWYKINGSLMAWWTCVNATSDGLKFAVFDSISGEPWMSSFIGYPYYGSHGEYHCQEAYSTPAFDFIITSANDSNMTKIVNFINSIPPNDYVLMMSHRNNHCQEWSNALVTAFRSIGSNVDIAPGTRITDGYPYILFGRKGAAPGNANYTIGDASGNLITLSDVINTKWKEGYVKSETIGPAAQWHSIHWRVKSIDPYLTDKIKLNVLGIKINGSIDTLIKNIPYTQDSIDIFNLETTLNHSVYPYLKLVAVMKDETFNTPSQMVRWQVLYDGIPETALDPSINYSFYKDTLMEGDSIRFSTAIHNISEYNMDSLLVHYWIIDQNRHVHPIYYHRYRPHPANDIIIGKVSFCTTGLQGINSLWIEVNPNNDQLEQYHFNNIGEVYFYVGADRINPLLDVTFDGVHILDGDIVSAKPQIEIRLKDENKFLLMNNYSDTSLFAVFIQKPGASIADRIYFGSGGNEIMKFFPTTSSTDNKCRIEYDANFPVDGTYKLIVQAKDVSQNKSGNFDYEINFEVINKSTITEVMNWPNPFSTSTRFVFTLTGSEIPTYFKIQIITITGKVVKEIELDELGLIHIGRNITQYAWNGKDDYGDQLANGVYLYRVITNINGKSIDKNPTGADKYFKEEFGKMVLMR
jgi:hypothetical protein